MAGDEEREDLVAELAVVHPALALLVVTRLEQMREQVVAPGRLCATLCDHPCDALVERMNGFLELPVLLARPEDGRVELRCGACEGSTESPGQGATRVLDCVGRRDLQPEGDGRRRAGGPGQGDGERGAERVALVEGVHVEEDLAGDLHGDARHLPRGVERLALGPGVGASPCGLRHLLGVTRDGSRLEEGRHPLALPAPQGALAREQTVADQRREHHAQEA